MLIPAITMYLLSIPPAYVVGKIYEEKHLPDTAEDDVRTIIRIVSALLPPMAAILSAQILLQMENEK